MDNSVKKSSSTEEIPKNAVRRESHRLLIFAVILILIIGTIVFVFALNNKKGSDTGPSSDASSTSEIKEPKEEPKSTEKVEEVTTPKSEDTDAVAVQNKAPIQQEGEDPNTLNKLTGVINYAAVNDDTLMIRVSIDQYLNSGTCLLELTSANDNFTLSDDIMPSASTSSCSYDISTNLLVEGKYEIKITANSEGKTGIIKGEVDV